MFVTPPAPLVPETCSTLPDAPVPGGSTLLSTVNPQASGAKNRDHPDAPRLPPPADMTNSASQPFDKYRLPSFVIGPHRHFTSVRPRNAIPRSRGSPAKRKVSTERTTSSFDEVVEGSIHPVDPTATLPVWRTAPLTAIVICRFGEPTDQAARLRRLAGCTD